MENNLVRDNPKIGVVVALVEISVAIEYGALGADLLFDICMQIER